MVVFDLMCLNGHQFEGWFANLADLEEQIKKKLLPCPVCGVDNVVRRPSTFGLVKSRVAESNERPTESSADPDNKELMLKALNQMKVLTQTLESEFADVGANFSNEALKMHFGVTPKRNIRGLSTFDEEEVMKKEGVEFFKVPMLVRKTDLS
ncbi:MAG: DUF1178 family protein [Deltaproteobacteria bacterium]|jgi:hypothetical protein|nr:DUF1178 family protein [Deltaproteobacteria bacterium]